MILILVFYDDHVKIRHHTACIEDWLNDTHATLKNSVVKTLVDGFRDEHKTNIYEQIWIGNVTEG